MDPAQAPITEVASFLDGLLAVRHKGNPLAPTTIARYRSAIVAIHQCFTDGSTVSSNTDLYTLLKGIFVVSARPTRTLRAMWDLPNRGVCLLPSLLLDHNQSVSFTPSAIFLPSLKHFSPDDRVHCPERVLDWTWS